MEVVFKKIRALTILVHCPSRRLIVSPSPTTSWYSGPSGCFKVLLVSTIGSGTPDGLNWVAPVGYLGGGGRTLALDHQWACHSWMFLARFYSLHGSSRRGMQLLGAQITKA